MEAETFDMAFGNSQFTKAFGIGRVTKESSWFASYARHIPDNSGLYLGFRFLRGALVGLSAPIVYQAFNARLHKHKVFPNTNVDLSSGISVPGWVMLGSSMVMGGIIGMTADAGFTSIKNNGIKWYRILSSYTDEETITSEINGEITRNRSDWGSMSHKDSEGSTA